jgi:CIC family chloride channel protein
MQRVLQGQSRIPPRDTFLKPLSAAIAIGTGGPFGAEGPIIASGGALGSLIGQLLAITADERKTLLAAGAAAGMAATFGSPVAAVLLGVELLLFEFRPRSLIPVALASVTAASLRIIMVGTRPMFAMPIVGAPGVAATACYVALGATTGLVAVFVTRAVYMVEDGFQKLPIHWMWWPAIGGLAVGIVGYFAPHTLGVGYYNIAAELSGRLALHELGLLCVLKFVSWVISLGSGTSGGTLAPLFIVGGALGGAAGEKLARLWPWLSIDAGIAALVGMTAMFAGASRALLASVVFALETTMRPLAAVPVLGGCTAAYLVSSLLMRDTIMTHRITRRGFMAPFEYSVDILSQLLVREAASWRVVTLRASLSVAETRLLLTGGGPWTQHHGFPVLYDHERLVGVISWREIFEPRHPPAKELQELLSRRPVVAFENDTLRYASDLMVREGVGRLPIVSREDPAKLIAILTRHDIMAAEGRYMLREERREQLIRLFPYRRRNPNKPAAAN